MENDNISFWGIGAGGASIVVLVIVVMVVIRALRRKAAQRISTSSRANNHTSTQVPQHPVHPSQNSHPLPNPYQTPYQQPPYPQHQVLHGQYHQPPHILQQLQQQRQQHHHHHHHPSPHTVLFPTQPMQTYFPVMPMLESSSMHDDHSLRPAVSATISLDELNTFDAKGDDRESPCPICLAPLEEEPVSTGNCLHLAHTSCLKSWLVKDAKFACPVCRVPLTDTSNDDVAIALAAPG